MLIDKGYYDYDYSEEAKDKGKRYRKMNRTEEEQKKVWQRMGFGNLRKPGQKNDKDKSSIENIQKIVMEEISGHKDKE